MPRTPHRLASSVLPIAALLLPAVVSCARPSGAQPPPDPVTVLAEAWSGGQTEPRCQPRGPRGEVLLGGDDARHCTWEPAPGSGAVGTVSAKVDVAGGPKLLEWVRPARDAADADRLIDSLGTAFRGWGLAERACGESDVPVGRVRGTVWSGTALVVHLSRIAPPEGAPRLHLMVTDLPSAFPMDVVCPSGPRAVDTATVGRVFVGDGIATLLRPDRLDRIVRYEGRQRDSSLVVLRYRTGGPRADSAAVRRELTAALADARGVEMRTTAGHLTPPGSRLVVRPCYTDHCPDPPRERGDEPQPGDMLFRSTAEWRWVPEGR